MAKKSSSPKNDESKVDVPDQIEIQDLEDQAIMFWEKNKGVILGSIAFIFAAFLGFQGFKYLQYRADMNLQAGYQAADTSAAKAAWAEDEAGAPLSGFAFKELGDEAYEAGDLAKAEDYYRKASKSAAAPIDQAATIALAVTLIDQDKAGEAKSLLQPIASDVTALAQAEAQYRLASIASQEGDIETARTLIEAISDESFFWKSRARSIEQTLPEA